MWMLCFVSEYGIALGVWFVRGVKRLFYVVTGGACLYPRGGVGESVGAVHGIVKVKRAILSVVFGGNGPVRTMPNNSSFGTIVSLKHTNIGTSFVDRTNGSHVNRCIVRFLESGNIGTSGIDVFPRSGSPLSLTFLSRGGGTSCVFCGSRPRSRLRFTAPRVGPNSVILFNSFFTLGPIIHPRITNFLRCTGGRNTVLCCSVGFHTSRRGRVVGVAPGLVRGLRCTSFIHKDRRSFKVLCGGPRTSGICGTRVDFCYGGFVYARNTRPMRIQTRGNFTGDCPSRGVGPIDAVKTNSGFGTNFMFKLVGSKVAHRSVGHKLSRTR